MSTAVATRPTSQMTSMQGIAIPAQSVNEELFKQLTRRHTQQEASRAFTGQTGDIFELRKSDILAGITIRFVGKLTVTTANIGTTARWPYDLLKSVKFAANGSTNLINVSGLKLKIRDLMKHGDLTDRGVQQTVAGSVRNQGTLARAHESWGVGSQQAANAIAPGQYDVDLEWFVPVAEDMIDLTGAIFLQTASADLTLALDYAQNAELFTGTGVPALTGNFQITTHKFSIPVGGDGQIVVPDLDSFHSLVQSRWTSLSNAENEIRVTGQGAGKALLRAFYQLYNGAGAASAPVPMTAANFGLQAWRYATNETPDQIVDGTQMRALLERRYNADLGGIWGVGCHEFASENTFRDTVDMGTTAELRFITTINQAVTLAAPAFEYVLETVYGAGQA